MPGTLGGGGGQQDWRLTYNIWDVYYISGIANSDATSKHVVHDQDVPDQL